MYVLIDEEGPQPAACDMKAAVSTLAGTLGRLPVISCILAHPACRLHHWIIDAESSSALLANALSVSTDTSFHAGLDFFRSRDQALADHWKDGAPSKQHTLGDLSRHI